MAKSTTFLGAPKPYGATGHFDEPRRHSLQAQGFKTGTHTPPPDPVPVKPKLTPPTYDYQGTHFKINDKIEIVCEHTKRGFTHIATLYINGQPVDSARIHYYNRTWEAYEFQSVMQKLVGDTKALTDAEKKMALGYIDKDLEKYEEGRVNAEFGTIGKIAMLGEIMGQTQKEKNDWKERMLKAGLGGRGLSMPDDWDALSENEKETRLNKVIAMLKEKPE